MKCVQPERVNLAAVRIFFFLTVFITVSGPDYFLQWSKVPPQFWYPRGFLRLFSEPLSPDVIVSSFCIWRWLTLACLFGVFFRWIAPIWWLLGLVVITNGHSYGYLGHVYMPVVLAGLPLCFSQASDAFSFDSWRKPQPALVNVQAYILPVRTMQVVLVLAYFAAGVSKLRFGGLEWITGDTLRNYLIRSSLIFSDSNQLAHVVQLNQVLYRIPWLCNVLAFGAVLLEVSMPLALWKRQFAKILVPAIVALQVGIFFTIFVRFTPYVALLGAWINWHWFLNWFWNWSFGRIRATPAV